MKTALSIAGSDSSGGAGIQADIKTMSMNGVYAMTAITALTAQNTKGVRGILEVPPEFLAEQLEAEMCIRDRPMPVDTPAETLVAAILTMPLRNCALSLEETVIPT